MDGNRTIISKTSEETSRLGGQIAECLINNWNNNSDCPPVSRIYCLYGDLGSGKTTFTQGFSKTLGITGRLLSPTFLILREHKTKYSERNMYHMDLYRIHSPQDLTGIGFEEILEDPHSCVIIEWAEKLSTLLPDKRTDIYFTTLDNGTHEIRIDHI